MYNRPKILIVDNTDSGREKLKEIVQDSFEIFEADDGVAALKILAEDNQFDIAIVDIIMPNMNGIELLRNIKSHVDLKHISVIMTTEVGAEAHEEKALNLGASDFISKPYNRNVVWQRVNNVLNRRNSQQTNALKETTKRMTTLIDSIPGGVCIFKYMNSNIAIIYKNDNIHKLAGYSEGEFDAATSEDVINIVYEEDRKLFYSEINQAIQSNKPLNVALRLVTRRCTLTWVQISATSIKDKDGSVVFYGVFTDFNKEKHNEQRTNAALKALKYRAEHDMLTGIYNRESFNRMTAELLEKNVDTKYVLLMVDIEKFKVINDIYGTEVGDHMLISIAQALEARLNGIGTYARLRADVFVMVFPTKDFQLSELSKIITTCFYGLNISHKVVIKSGIYYIDDIKLPVEQMCDRAAIAVQTIKGKYLQDYAVYDNNLRDVILREQEIVSEMNAALEEEQFIVYLQPIFSVSEGQVVSAEALVRWLHPTKGLIMPSVFIPLFEKNGFIIQLDKYMLIKVCRLIKEMEKRGEGVVPISVNLSRAVFSLPSLAEEVIDIVKQEGVSPQLVKLEITESAYTQSPELLLSTMKKLQQSGFKILMDDFGSGYSSLNMLKDVEVDLLKIDVKFLEGFEKNSRSACILTSIIRMAKWLDMPVIAEGVETQNEVDFLKSIGCDMMQGYWFSKPVTIEEFYIRKKQIIKDRGAAEAIERNDLSELFETNFLTNKIFNSVFGGIAIFELVKDNLELLRVNEGYYDLMQYNPKTLFDNNKKFLLSVHKSDRASLIESCKRAISTKQTQHIAIRKLLTDNSILWLDVKTSYLGGTSVRPIVVLTFIDISSQKNLEQERYLYRFNVAMRKVYNAVFEVDLDKFTSKPIILPKSEFLEVHEDALDCNIAIANFISKIVTQGARDEFMRFADPQFIIKNCTSAEENPTITLLYKTQRDKELWIEISLLYVAPQKFLCCIKDVDNQKRQELANNALLIKETEQRESTSKTNIINLLQQVPVGIIKYRASDKNNNIIYANDNILTMLNCSREELVTHYDNSFTSLLAKEDCERVLKSIREYNKDQTEYRLVQKSGEYIDVYNVAEYVTYENNESCVYILISQNSIRTKFFQSVINNMPCGVSVFRINNKIEPVYLSETLLINLGYSAKDYKECLQKNDYSAFSLNFTDMDKDLYNYYISEEVFEHLLYTKNKVGAELCLKLTGKFAKFGDEEKLCFATVVDVTKEKSKKEEEYTENQRNKLIAQNLKNVTFDYDIKSDTCVYSIFDKESNKYTDVTLYNFLAFYPQTELVYQADRIPFLLWFKKILHSTSSNALELRLNFFNKAFRWYQCDAGCIFNSNKEKVKIIGNFRDINLEKTIALNSEEALDMLCSIINTDAISVSRILWQDNLPIVFANEMFYKMRGCTKETAPATADVFTIKEEKERVGKLIVDSIRSGKRYLSYETRIRDINNNSKYILRCSSIHFVGSNTYIDNIDQDITEKIMLINAAKIHDEIYQSVTEHTDAILFELDFADHIIYYSYLTPQGNREHRSIRNFRYEFVDSGILSREDFDLFGKAFCKHAAHPLEKETVFEFKCNLFGNGFSWYNVTIKSVVENKDAPHRVVGRCEKIDKLKLIQSQYESALSYKKILLDNCLYSFEFYLDSNIITVVEDNTSSIPELFDAECYVMPKQCISHVYFEDIDTVSKLMNGKILMSKYETGQTTCFYDFRLITTDNNLRWVRATQYIICDKILSNFKCVTVVKNISNDSTISENKLNAQLDIDPLTLLLTRKAFVDKLKKRMANTTRANLAFVIIDIDNYKSITTKFGIPIGENVLSQIGYYIPFIFGDNELLARIDSDRFAIAITFDEYNESFIKTQLKLLQNELKKLPSAMECNCEVVVSMGVAFTVYPDIYNYDSLYKKALEQLNIAKSKGKNKISYMNIDHRGIN